MPLALLHLAVALAIGLLIGLERGWKRREAEEGERVAGVRTFGLIGLLGGVSGLLGEKFGALLPGMVFVALAGILATAYVVNLGRGGKFGITSLVAATATFLLGVLATTGELVAASASAVIMALLLGHKARLHHWVRALTQSELAASFKLLLISVVMLPVLPNQGLGPWEALNPFVIWLMVVLIAAISFVGYFAVRIAGPRRGMVFTGLFGGLASSTGVTLHFSRLAARGPGPSPILAGGILLACGTMYPRMLLLASAFNPALFRPLLLPALIMASITYLPVARYLRRPAERDDDDQVTVPKNPVELKTALVFGLLLAVIMLLGRAMTEWYGDAGIWLLSAASGIADVDAITLSLARMSAEGLVGPVAAMGIVIAAAVNSLVKGAMATVIGGRSLGWYVGLPLLLAATGGLLLAWLGMAVA